jgi:hypothetical protein
MDSELTIYFRSLKKRAAKAAQDGLAPVHSTKRPLPFSVYKSVALHLLKATGVINQVDATQYVFGHLFWLMGWNTMTRSQNTQSISLTHIDWADDCLLVNICQAKNDQEGVNAERPKHIYANPITPEICPVLSLGIFFSLVGVTPNQSKLFEGKNQSDRFRQFLIRFCDLPEVCQALQRDAFDKHKLGTHSLRKGSATYCASGTTAAPAQSAIDIRGGWSQGKIKDVYQHYQAAGDQYLGRIVCGLPRMSAEFAILPPTFKATVTAAYIKDIIGACFPTLPIHMQLVGTFALASLVHHSNFLRATLPENHVLFDTYLFRTSVLQQLKELVVCEMPSPTTTRPSGIPPDILLGLQIQAVPGQIQQYLEERSILANRVTPQFIKDILEDQYIRMCTIHQPAESINQTRSARHDSNQDIADDLPMNELLQGQYPMYTWGGAIRHLPETYQLPKVTLRIIWQHWWFGDKEKRIPPLRFVTGRDYKDRRRFSELKRVATLMTSVLRNPIQQPSINQANEMYEEAARVLRLDALLGHRAGQKMWTTAVKALLTSPITINEGNENG